MSVLPFLAWPDPRLQTAVTEVSEISPRVHAIWEDMIDTMYAMPGVGLSAPQVGIMEALAVVDGDPEKRQPLRMANPQLVQASSEMSKYQEGSPNLPGLWADVVRPATITVRFLDVDGQLQEQDFEGLWATSIQHQIDHMAGRMFFDRLSATKRRMILAKYAKGQKKRGRG